jgi:HK97 family phage prohead protease
MKQYKDFQTKIEDVDEKGRVLVAANAIGNIDSDEDRSMSGSFSKTLKENFNRLKWFLNHKTDQLLGVPVEGKEDGTYLKMLGQLNMKKQLSLDTYEDYKLYAEYGRSLEHSIGVEALKKQERDGIREVYEWKMWEYSTLTAWGANEDTPLLGIKSDKDVSDLIEWFTIRLKKGKYTDEKFSQIDQQLLQLKSLLIEPEKSTHDEPMKSEPVTATRIIRKESDFILTTFIN